jgi:hypothetical protein
MKRLDDGFDKTNNQGDQHEGKILVQDRGVGKQTWGANISSERWLDICTTPTIIIQVRSLDDPDPSRRSLAKVSTDTHEEN